MDQHTGALVEPILQVRLDFGLDVERPARPADRVAHVDVDHAHVVAVESLDERARLAVEPERRPDVKRATCCRERGPAARLADTDRDVEERTRGASGGERGHDGLDVRPGWRQHDTVDTVHESETPAQSCGDSTVEACRVWW